MASSFTLGVLLFAGHVLWAWTAPFFPSCLMLCFQRRSRVCEKPWAGALSIDHHCPPQFSQLLAEVWSCFLIVFPKNITTATYWVNPPPSVQGVRREGNVGLISPGIFWVLCPSHETGRFEDPFLPLYLMGSWQCCQSYLSHQHYILLQSVGQGQQYIKQGGEFVHFATCLFLSLLNLLICHPL